MHRTIILIALISVMSNDDYATASQSLLISPTAVKVALHRLRQRFGEVLREIVAETVDDFAEVDGINLRQVIESRGIGVAESLDFELSAEGRQKLAKLNMRDSTAAGLGLVVNGILQGISLRNDISNQQVMVTLASESSVDPMAIVAAVRGPELGASLELLD